MQNKLFLKAADICELLEVKQTSAYEIIGNLNKELEEQGYLTLRGKVPTKYFVKRLVHTYNFERCHSALNNQTPASCYYPILLLDDHAA